MQYKNQSGNTLLITLIILIVFSILGISLMSLSLSGLSKNEIRQDNVRSEDLSEKGIDRITHQINSELTKNIEDNNGLTRTNFINVLNSTLNKYKCSSIDQITDIGKTGTYKTCIKEIKPTYEIGNPNVENELRKLIVFESHGISGNATKTMTTEIEIGAESAPETLKYAVGTNINPKDGFQEGEGNLFMHGGVTVKGDFKVDGNIITRDRGYATIKNDSIFFPQISPYWILSLLPESIPTDGVPNSKIVLGKDFYTFNSNLNYDKHIANNNFNNGYQKQSDIKELFWGDKAPKIIVREPVVSTIGITEQRSNFFFSNGEKLSTGTDKKIEGVEKPLLRVIPTYTVIECTKRNWSKCVEERKIEKEDATFEMTGKNTFEQLSTIGGLEIVNSNSTFRKGLYVERNLQIGNKNTSYNSKNYSDIILDGPIYVKGNVNIQGANLESNVLLYVEGDVNIQYSTIKGKSLVNGKKGSLIIFAKGQIKIANNSVNQDTPSQIKGFFYTEKDLEIFGVGSNIRIEGGISARKIVLNAIRGRASASKFNGSQEITSNSYFEGEIGQRSKDSRLQIIYDQDIIETFSNLKQPEPIIYKVEPPIVKDREI